MTIKALVKRLERRASFHRGTISPNYILYSNNDAAADRHTAAELLRLEAENKRLREALGENLDWIERVACDTLKVDGYTVQSETLAAIVKRHRAALAGEVNKPLDKS